MIAVEGEKVALMSTIKPLEHCLSVHFLVPGFTLCTNKEHRKLIQTHDCFVDTHSKQVHNVKLFICSAKV